MSDQASRFRADGGESVTSGVRNQLSRTAPAYHAVKGDSSTSGRVCKRRCVRSKTRSSRERLPPSTGKKRATAIRSSLMPTGNGCCAKKRAKLARAASVSSVDWGDSGIDDAIYIMCRPRFRASAWSDAPLPGASWTKSGLAGRTATRHSASAALRFREPGRCCPASSAIPDRAGRNRCRWQRFR